MWFTMPSQKNVGTCKYGFSFPIYPETKITYNTELKKWDYYRPIIEDRNVVSYHASILLLWGAHMNI